MNSEDSIDPTISVRCRICWEEQGAKISVCNCSGSMGLVHQDCLSKWIQKSLEREHKKAIKRQDGTTSVTCELCKGDITFSMQEREGCLNCSDILENIKQNKGTFIIILFIIIGLCVIGTVFLIEVIKDFKSDTYKIWSVVFILIFVLIVFAIMARFICSFIETFFRGHKYAIASFQKK